MPPDLIFVRNFVGGPFVGCVFMVSDRTLRIQVVHHITAGVMVIGYYIRSNLGWVWHAA